MSPGRARVFGRNFNSQRAALNRATMALQAVHAATNQHRNLIRAMRAAEQIHRNRSREVQQSGHRINKLRAEYHKLARRAKRNVSANFKKGPLTAPELRSLRGVATQMKNMSSIIRTMKRVNLPTNVKLKIIRS